MSSSIPVSSVSFIFDPVTKPNIEQTQKEQIGVKDAGIESDKFFIRLSDGSTRTLNCINNKTIAAHDLSPEQQKEMIACLKSQSFSAAFGIDVHFRERQFVVTLDKQQLPQMQRVAKLVAEILAESSTSATGGSGGSGGGNFSRGYIARASKD